MVSLRPLWVKLDDSHILALMSLIGLKRHVRPAIVAVGLFGAALIYGDDAITLAISMLSALEGLNMATPALQPYVLPLGLVILILLFAVQPLGTERIGNAFGPIMALWFLALAAMGISGVVQHPTVLAALDPAYGLKFLAFGGAKGFLVLGGVFVCVTGAEALYADMGHFGAPPIRLVWTGLVFPSLILNYAGQAAIVLEGAWTDGNVFYHLCPPSLLIGLVVLATVATVIASQSIITGAFSMTRQAIQLGWLPRLAVKQTSGAGYGQIYVGSVNWILMAVTVALTLGFKKSDNLASAYGIAVSLTMLMTTLLLYIAMREIWKWSIMAAGAAATFLFVVDGAFFTANLARVAEGGYVPLLLATVIFGIMWIWHGGTAAVARRLQNKAIRAEEFEAIVVGRNIPREPGTAVFLTRANRDVPPALLWHLELNRALHNEIIVLTVNTASVPWIDADKHLTIEELAPNFWRAGAVFGFMEHPDIPALLDTALGHGCTVDFSDVIYYVGHGTIVHRDDGKGLPHWQEVLFAAMERNSSHVADILRFPQDRTLEIGGQVAI